MNGDFTDWYKVKSNANILILNKEKKEIEQYKNQKYDYIYLNGTLENSKQIINSKNPTVDLIKFFKELLNENGILFIAVDNKMGVKYLVGDKSEHCNNIYDSLKGEFCIGELFSKKELDEIIEKTGFKYKKYYYPLPNYQKPNVIFTDEKLPAMKDSKLNYNFIYDENSLILQDEINLLKIFNEENKFIEFTNSYIVELSNKEINTDIKYYSFNNMRKDKYSLILRMKDGYVEKYPKTEEAIEHIKNINKYSQRLKELGFYIAEEENCEDIVRSKFINLELLDEQIVKSIEDKQKTYELIDNWYKYISEKLNVSQGGIVEEGFIDLVFENTFFDAKKGEYIFFDQEWFEKNVPIKFILFRAIKNLYEHNPRINTKLPKEEMFDKYQLKEHIEEFTKREEQFQKEIIDEQKKKFYEQQYKYKITSEEIQKVIDDVKRLDKDNLELLREIKRLEEKIKYQDDIIKKSIEKNRTIIDKIKEKILKK